MEYRVIEMDLFEMGPEWDLAHCISGDCRMGAGIAKEFRARYPHMAGQLLRQNPTTGTCLTYLDEERVIFNLITKPRYFHKPTRESFNDSITRMRDLMVAMGRKNLAIPTIGSGLDRLRWEDSEAFIQGCFSETDIAIVVCLY